LEAVKREFKGPKVIGRVQFLSDNGGPYIADNTEDFAEDLGFEVCTTLPYTPEANGCAEAFVKSFKTDYVQISGESTAEGEINALHERMQDFNELRPHSALKYLSPLEFKQKLAAARGQDGGVEGYCQTFFANKKLRPLRKKLEGKPLTSSSLGELGIAS
jgi:transposase InsO family protein